MAIETYANNAVTTLSGAINDSQTYMDVIDSTLFPTSGQTRVGVGNEIILVKGGLGTNSWNPIERGVENTQPASHNAGINVEQILTNQGLLNLVPLSKYDATTAPTVSDDSGDGYSVGSVWVDITGDASYICVDPAVGAAIWNPFNAPGGAGPLLYADSLALHADGDEFDDPALPGWTLGGGLTTGDVTAVTTEPYDDTCLDIVFGAQSDRMYKTIFAGDGEITLTFHGVNNDGADPLGALGGMLALVFTNDSGNGTGMSLYNERRAHMWAIAGNAYSSTGNELYPFDHRSFVPPSGSLMPIVYKLKKVGSTITGSVSDNGGISFASATRSDSTTFTRMGITRLWSGGGTNPTLRVGRFNVEEL